MNSPEDVKELADIIHHMNNRIVSLLGICEELVVPMDIKKKLDLTVSDIFEHQRSLEKIIIRICEPNG